MASTPVNTRSYWDRVNDLACRDFSCRLARRLRSCLRQAGERAICLADEPRVIRAWQRGWEAPHFVQLMRWRHEGFAPSVFYDIGAHRGIWAEMCQAVLAPAESHLFEPVPEHLAEIDRRRVAAAGNWRVWPVALSDQAGSTKFHVNRQSAASSVLPPNTTAPPEFWGGAESRQLDVRVETLDAWVAAQGLPAPDFVKLDVQGLEARVLAGGEQTIRQARRLVVEVSLRSIYEGQALMGDVFQTLSGWGFVLDDAGEALRRWPRGGLWQLDLWMRNPARA